MEESHQDETTKLESVKILVIRQGHSARTFQQKSFGKAIRQFPEA
jgi:hypothetical protein